jgi:hypothetical protein
MLAGAVFQPFLATTPKLMTVLIIIKLGQVWVKKVSMRFEIARWATVI